MYDAPITDAARSKGYESTQLREFEWPELVAKLAAMRELRLGLARQNGPSRGAFSSLTDLREGGTVNGMEGAVNLNALADRKGPAPNNAALNNQDMQLASPRDREIT